MRNRGAAKALVHGAPRQFMYDATGQEPVKLPHSGNGRDFKLGKSVGKWFAKETMAQRMTEDLKTLFQPRLDKYLHFGWGTETQSNFP